MQSFEVQSAQRQNAGGSSSSSPATAIVAAAAGFAKNRPVTTSLWAIGLLVAAMGNGFSVTMQQMETYQEAMSHAHHVTDRELSQARRLFREADQRYYNAKGWFWSCDATCQKMLTKRDLAQAQLYEVETKRDGLIREARQTVGIWSTIGVQEVRERFWHAWEQGKETAKRWTMMDALFMALPGDRERTFVQVILQLIFQYLTNLTVGMMSAMFIFLWQVGALVYNYGENFVSGTAFFGLVAVSCISVVTTYLGLLGGAVVGGVTYVVNKEQERLAGGGERRRVHGTGASGYRRPHAD
ncbi:unnamed protein product [Amoebophrya sp. A120]|nr:unnamed protein product [Amoebophrya sp. A120]|eukprot:GSA120T00005482001.1